ncbi:alpha/beta hydrolase [Paramagnetospirillum kuznetsovii]|uniref:Alpha/beta hydrolase n=1 Tax=Paramagnetospirillum kuznetsovii TaxID=2053833 RepID=A0A364NXR6_9PROT|nr:alpha/beta fold hydrolase [Paramagnetospirillum kuznetsovii]RAU21695.1 alpha/beta hydrolase [Paramagnetospirillum kuznetsovii]
MKLGLKRLVAVVGMCLGLSQPSWAVTVVSEEFKISSKQPNVELYLRNKHPEALYSVKPERTVLFIHGASYPAHSSFDFPIDGKSWMDWLAEQGYDVYSLDIRGYGKSTRPPEMKQTPEANAPIVDTIQAVEDLSSAVDFILSRRNSQQLTLVGWSWGATVAGTYASTSAERVGRLVLYAPQWLRNVAPPSSAEMAKVPAWRNADPRHARDIWLKGVPADKRDTVLPKSVFNAWVTTTLASDSEPAVPGTVRAPNGVVLDTMKYWASGKPRWNPELVSSPVLVIQGEWDAEAPPAMGLVVFNTLTHASFKRYVMVGESSHAALFEANRRQLYQAVQEFIEAPIP